MLSAKIPCLLEGEIFMPLGHDQTGEILPEYLSFKLGIWYNDPTKRRCRIWRTLSGRWHILRWMFRTGRVKQHGCWRTVLGHIPYFLRQEDSHSVESLHAEDSKGSCGRSNHVHLLTMPNEESLYKMMRAKLI